ncbi:hypothetical protein PAJ34TS1_21300 [Paenibacillus azoreducens]|uniref:Uncharacterized protein n=1 Tax=Paenibacillus azoreducens TaxID=116718 RepID=A0A919YJD6_9BACL|nr:hypothetical protein J34TS1_45050 [Paenibacillus azoreducens]
MNPALKLIKVFVLFYTLSYVTVTWFIDYFYPLPASAKRAARTCYTLLEYIATSIDIKGGHNHAV